MKGKTQARPEVVRQVDDEAVVEEVAEHVPVAERGSAEQVEVANGQQHEPDEVVVPTLWQWLRKEGGFRRIATIPTTLT